MSNDIMNSDPAYQKLAEVSRKREFQPLERFPEKRTAQTGFAPTYIIARYDGGVGASTLAAMLMPFLTNPLLIEIGGNKPRALKSVDRENRIHIPFVDHNPFGEALDARIQNASRTAIIECEQTAYRDAIEATTILRGAPFHNAAYLLIILAGIDNKLALVDLAHRSDIDDPIVFAQGGYSHASSEDIIRIPTLPKQLQTEIYQNGKGVLEALRDNQTMYTATIFAHEYVRFGKQVHDRIEG